MISFGGLASGLDTQAIIQAMLSVERVPLNMLEAQKAEENAKLDKVSAFKDLVKALQTAAGNLRTMGEFLDFTVSPSQENVAAFSATGSAEEGAHTLTVLSLAQADRWAFDGVLDPDTDLAGVDGEQVDFTANGTSYSIALTAADSSLNEIASQINTLAGDDVTASVVNVGTASTPDYQLVLASDETGEDGRITGISSTVAGLTIDGAGPDGGGNPLSTNNVTVGTNAQAIIDGLTVERASNDFNDVIAGVSITVQAADAATEISFNVGADTEAIKGKVQSFVDAYNEVINFANSQSSYSEDGGTGGVLFGDSILRSVRRTIQSALFDVDLTEIQNDTTGYSTLSLVGIKTDSDGALTLDSTIFDDKMAANMDALADLFTDSDGFDNGGAAEGTPEYFIDTTTDSGLADKLYRQLDTLFGKVVGPSGSVDALFDARSSAIGDLIDDIGDQITSKERYLEIYEQRLVDRFAALEQLMGGLNAQGAALTAALSGMSNLYSNN